MSDVLCQCRCGVCCKEMTVRVNWADAMREPRILAEGRPIPGTEDEPEFILNRAGANGSQGPCVFLEETGDVALCGIHATRPEVCRLVDCDQLLQLGSRLAAGETPEQVLGG